MMDYNFLQQRIGFERSEKVFANKPDKDKETTEKFRTALKVIQQKEGTYDLKIKAFS